MDTQGNESTFKAEAEVHDKAMRASTVRARSYNSRSGELDAVAASGGIDPDLNESSETEPLLSPSPKKSRSGSDSSDHWGERHFDGLPWYKRPSMWWVLVPFGFLAIAYGGILAPRVNLISNLICQDFLNEQDEMMPTPGMIRQPVMLDGSNQQCNIPEVERRSALFLLYGNLIAGLLSAITAPKLGALSDRFGRTKIIAITSIGSLSGDIFIILAAKYSGTVSVNWVLVGYALDGICGSFTTAFAIVHAYATDCTPPSERNIAFSYFHGCLFTGIAIGPIMTGLIVKYTGTPITPFYIMLAVHLFFTLFMGFVVPESLSKQRKQSAQEKHRSIKAERSTDWIETLREINLLAPLKILWPSGRGVNPALRRNMVLLAAVDTMMFGVAMGSSSVILIYIKYQFGWQTYEAGVYMTIVNTCRVFCLLGVLPVLTRLIRGKPNPQLQKPGAGADKFDIGLIRTAVFFDTLGYAGYALATSGNMMIASGVVAAIGGMGSPTLQSALTKHVRPENTGQLLGASGLLHSLARVVAPTVFNGIYAATNETFRQAVFVCLASVFGLAFVCTWFIRPNVSWDDVPPQHDDEDVTVQEAN